jgi:hypothetical protein
MVLTPSYFWGMVKEFGGIFREEIYGPFDLMMRRSLLLPTYLGGAMAGCKEMRKRCS